MAVIACPMSPLQAAVVGAQQDGRQLRELSALPGTFLDLERRAGDTRSTILQVSPWVSTLTLTQAPAGDASLARAARQANYGGATGRRRIRCLARSRCHGACGGQGGCSLRRGSTFPRSTPMAPSICRLPRQRRPIGRYRHRARAAARRRRPAAGPQGRPTGHGRCCPIDLENRRRRAASLPATPGRRQKRQEPDKSRSIPPRS